MDANATLTEGMHTNDGQGIPTIDDIEASTPSGHTDLQTESQPVQTEPTCARSMNKSDHWLNRISREQHSQLVSRLVELDKKHRLHYSDEHVQRIYSGVEAIMESMKRKFDETQDFGLVVFPGRGRLVKCGSFFHETKIGSPNEMDYAFVFNKDDVDQCVAENWTEQLAKVGEDCIFREIQMLCSHGISKVDFSVPRLQGWAHGGFNGPSFSGYRRSGPAYMYQFTYANPDNVDSEPLSITVDLVLAIETPADEFHKSVEDGSCNAADDHIVSLERAGHPSQAWRLFPPLDGPDPLYTQSSAELSWIGQFDRGDPVKVAIRLLKIFNSSSHPGQKDIGKSIFYEPVDMLLGLSSEADVDDKIKFFQSQKLLTYQVTDLLQDIPLLSSNQEVYQDLSYFASYVIQILVCILQVGSSEAEQGSSKRENIWTNDDIPRIVATVLDIIYTCVEFSRHQCTKDSKGAMLEVLINDKKYRSKTVPKKLFKLLYITKSVKKHIMGMIDEFRRLAGDNIPSYVNDIGEYYSEGQWDIVTHRCLLFE